MTGSSGWWLFVGAICCSVLWLACFLVGVCAHECCAATNVSHSIHFVLCQVAPSTDLKPGTVECTAHFMCRAEARVDSLVVSGFFSAVWPSMYANNKQFSNNNAAARLLAHPLKPSYAPIPPNSNKRRSIRLKLPSATTRQALANTPLHLRTSFNSPSGETVQVDAPNQVCTILLLRNHASLVVSRHMWLASLSFRCLQLSFARTHPVSPLSPHSQ